MYTTTAAMQLRPLCDVDGTATIGTGKEVKGTEFDEGFLQSAAMLKDPLTLHQEHGVCRRSLVSAGASEVETNLQACSAAMHAASLIAVHCVMLPPLSSLPWLGVVIVNDA